MTHYRAASPATMRIVPLDALTVIYHRASGITHIVDAPVPEILDALRSEAMSLDALLAKLAGDYELVDADPAALAARLDELIVAGLVERT